MKTILTIAGFDPSSGAGITADLAVIAAHSHFGTSAVTCLTVQSTQGVKATHAVDASILLETIHFLVLDIPPQGIKIGMLATEENVHATARSLGRLRQTSPHLPVVLDPVLRSSSGKELLSPAGLTALRDRLLPLVDWVTPNRVELEALGGAEYLLENFPDLNVVITGGDHDATDLILTVEGDTFPLHGGKIESRATHGTGCAFSTALVCNLVSGMDGPTAAFGAKAYVTEAIRRATPIGHGNGPMELFWPLRPN